MWRGTRAVGRAGRAERTGAVGRGTAVRGGLIRVAAGSPGRSAVRATPILAAALPVAIPVAVAATTARLAYRRLRTAPPGGAPRWTRVNNRGRSVTLLEGSAVAVGIAAGAAFAPNLPPAVRATAAATVLAAGAVGLHDDLHGSSAKGFRGH